MTLLSFFALFSFVFFKQKTAYEMRISDWSSDVCSSDLQPRVSPRPDDPALFLQGLLEGVAAVEALGYRRLAELGAPPARRVISVGGGASNAAWSAKIGRASCRERVCQYV